ncbi:hypothetical protein LTR66_016142, partial [Elasticomyces elasticus]
WNPAAEMQAIERVHRIGQRRPVDIYYFIMRDSFEEKMLELQHKKKALAEMTMSNKLTKAEEAKKKLEDLKSLFK